MCPLTVEELRVGLALFVRRRKLEIEAAERTCAVANRCLRAWRGQPRPTPILVGLSP